MDRWSVAVHRRLRHPLLHQTAGPQSERVTVVANHEMYALNGTAQDANLWPAFDPIWRDDPIAPGMKINIGPMIERGLALCEG